MEIAGKVIAVTGGANGIGRALCRRFAEDGAKSVTVADIDQAGARAVANEIGGFAIRCDVTREEDIVEVVRQTEEKMGRIDLFCSNAGIMSKGGVEVANEAWQLVWDIHVMAHIYAARAVIPGMIERGGGYLLNTASAAGLLTQIGAAPYSVTKYAAVGLAESLAINYGARGIGVSVICPQAVHTQMAKEGGGVAAVDGLMEPEQVADSVVEGLAEERFLILPHAEVQAYMQRKVTDYDRWLAGMQRFKKRFDEGSALRG
jgi:NAD(P)-dependent dehydrogenase (short-subunit alcohol dehydrogenase family)